MMEYEKEVFLLQKEKHEAEMKPMEWDAALREEQRQWDAELHN